MFDSNFAVTNLWYPYRYRYRFWPKCTVLFGGLVLIFMSLEILWNICLKNIFTKTSIISMIFPVTSSKRLFSKSTYFTVHIKNWSGQNRMLLFVHGPGKIKYLIFNVVLKMNFYIWIGIDWMRLFELINKIMVILCSFLWPRRLVLFKMFFIFLFNKQLLQNCQIENSSNIFLFLVLFHLYRKIDRINILKVIILRWVKGLNLFILFQLQVYKI